MNIDANLRLSYYKKIADLCPEHDVFIVQHNSTKQIYVQKELSLYNKDIYNYLLEHHLPNTPIIYDVIEMESSLVIIEEYISGTNLQDYIETNGPMNQSEVTSILTRLCSVLEPLHSMKPPIVHRDIKASNVILSNSGEIYLIDFNAAKFSNSGSATDTVLLGTRGYAAPEQYGFGSSSVQTDIYALGMLANFLLYGSLEKAEHPSCKLDNIIMRCTELNPKDRFETIISLKNELSPSHAGNWTLPGFRSHNPKKMLWSVLYYIMAALLSITLHVETTDPAIVVMDRVACFILMFGTFFICNDYMGIRSFMPFNDSTDSKRRTAGLIIGIFVFFFMVALIASLLQNIFIL